MKFDIKKTLRYLPLLAIVPESYAVGKAINENLDWHIIVVVISALLVAGTGFWGVQVTNAMAEFNATIRYKERTMKWELPTHKGWRVLAVWFGAVTLLTLMLDVWTVLQDLTPIGLVVVGFAASYLFSLSNLHASRVEEREAHRQKEVADRQALKEAREEERKAEKKLKQEVARKREEAAQALADKGIKLQPSGHGKISNELLLLYWEQDPTLTPTEMAKKLVEDKIVSKITRQAVKGRLDSMVSKGLVVVQDGRVVTYAQVGEGSGSESDS